ncbi:MAG: alpha-amylase [Lachnospiraceae bacterium]|nr:alpha-amylase [Lachnospiraceae bacterium]
MATQTDLNLQKQLIYSIYVRSHTKEGTFRAVIPDLDRIRALGTDIIWFMPIHPIGEKGKKGSLGCPYANKDYRSVNPAYGTMEDFKELVEEIHNRGMKCIIDVVYNHTSPDAVLVTEHPEFYYRKADGSFGNRCGEWSDVIDLDYDNRALWDYQIESLKMWATIVDGFRCDVASFVPVEFWKEARAAVETVHPGCIWLAESVHQSFGNFARRNGIYSAKDYELYEAFDLEYEYDIREIMDRYLKGEAHLSQWTDAMNMQEAIYPDNYNKMRCLENHDQPRIASFVKDEMALRNYTAMMYFMKGTTLIYAGQEFANTHLPSLFEQEPIDYATGTDLTPLLQTLIHIKKQQFGVSDYFFASADDDNDIAIMERGSDEKKCVGVFSLKAKSGAVTVELPDGDYENLIDGTVKTVKDGRLEIDGTPVILTITQ